MPIGNLPCFPLRIGVISLTLSMICSCPQASAQSSEEILHTTSEVRSALNAERARIAAHPKDPGAYIDLAYTLMDAGVADEAIEQGRMATQVDPHSALAFSAYGWLLRHNAIGIDYGKGYNQEASFAAYRKAIELSPDDLDIRQSLSDSLSFDADGLRYGPTARLDLSIDALRYIQAHQRPVAADVANNLTIDLFYANRYTEAIKEAQDHPPTPILDGAILAATAILESPTAALALADKLTGERSRRSVALEYAAEALWTVRHYPQAAALLEADQDQQAGNESTLRKIQLFRSLQPYSSPVNSGSDPLAPVRELMVAGLEGTLSEASLHHLFALHAYPAGREWEIDGTDLRALAGVRQTLSQQTGLPAAVVVDIVMGNLRLNAEPEARPGQAKVDAQILGSSSHIFLVQEDQRYQIVATAEQLTPIGEEALYLVNQNKLQDAIALLNWKREFSQTTPDDPLGGVLFAHVWRADQNPDAESIRFAAASLMTGSASAAALLQDLILARDKATGSRQGFLTLLIASIELAQKDGVRANTEAKRLLSHYPESLTAIRLCGQVFRMNSNWADWQAMLAPRLAAKPDNPDLLREHAAEQLPHGEYAAARRTYRILLDGGRATPADQNQYAWLSLFAGNIDSSAADAAESASAARDPGSAALETLACIYAVQGRSADARNTLLRAMTAAHRVEPDGGIWLGLGLLYEQYGEKQAAIAAFRRVNKSSGRYQEDDPYALAQLNLKRLAQPDRN